MFFRQDSDTLFPDHEHQSGSGPAANALRIQTIALDARVPDPGRFDPDLIFEKKKRSDPIVKNPNPGPTREKQPEST